jgi:sialate O-acetylesterase
MRRVSLVVLLSLISLFVFQTVQAKIKLPAIVASNMVLQRNTTIQLWGWAEAGEQITLTTSWLDEPISIIANNEGNWSASVQTTNSKESQTIELKSTESDITLDNVLFGEVWLCSGQSNMNMPVKGWKNQPTYGGIDAIIKSSNPNLRLFTVKKIASKTPLKDLEKYETWQEANPGNVLYFSAVAYFFGQQLQEVLDVPVGLIHTSWGGSIVQAWMSEDVVKKYQEVNLANADLAKAPQYIPSTLFNSMIKPLIPFTIKGALWYQGESNQHEPDRYKELFPAMVKDWRQRWNIGDFPFYYVQIAPFIYKSNEHFQTYKNTAFIREAQLQCLDSIPNSGIAITMDIGDRDCIHPPHKKEVADRLLYNALSKTYDIYLIDCASPIYESKEAKDNGLILKFKNVKSGLYAYDDLEGFEIAGEDRVFYPAKAKIVNRKELFVESNKVSQPVAVRYAWRNWVVGTLYNGNLLPAPSFRTDNWDDATLAKVKK